MKKPITYLLQEERVVFNNSPPKDEMGTYDPPAPYPAGTGSSSPTVPRYLRHASNKSKPEKSD